MFAQLTQFDLHHRLGEADGISLVYFSAPHCGACRHLARALTEARLRHPEWGIYEVDAQAEMGLVREFEVFHLPSMFLFVNGHYHRALHSEARADAIEKAIDEALSQPAEEAP